MADNTRVNELQDKLLKAMDILNAQALNSISFDKTITCTIENDKDKKQGKYEVTDGSAIFVAYSTDDRYRNGDVVYVTIPQGNYENQKIIIGKKTSEIEKPFNFVTPFDSFFSMTENLAATAKPNGLTANDIVDSTKSMKDCMTYVPLLGKWDENGKLIEEGIKVADKDLINYTRLGIKADFKSWTKNAVRGNYGLAIILTAEKQGTVKEEANTTTYTYVLDSVKMYGNPYSFETYYNQELVLDIGQEDIGKIIEIKANFYQLANFYTQFNAPIPNSIEGFKINENQQYLHFPVKEESGEKPDNSGYYIGQGDKLANNLFIDNLEIYFGYDISTFSNDYVEIYTPDRTSYRRSVSTTTDNTETNKKEINMRWVHVMDGEPVDMVASAGTTNDGEKPNYEVRWYRYRVGAAAADSYSGIYWERLGVKKQNIENKTTYSLFALSNEDYNKPIEERYGELQQFTELQFNPDVNKQQEKIKAIVIYDNNIPYRSNELFFENEEELPLSEEAQHIMNALVITCKDETNGNYMIYGQDNTIKDSEHGKTTRELEAWFDINNDGRIDEDTEKINDEGIANLIWNFPDKASMIQLINGDDTGLVDDQGKKILSKTTVTGRLPEYKIASYYSPSNSNNTIKCQYLLNGVVYSTEKEFTFGPAGTMGSDQTLVIDFIGDKNSVIVGEEVVKFEIRLYDNQNRQQSIPDNSVEWKWYYNSDLNDKRDNNGNLIGFPQNIDDSKNAIWNSQYNFKLDGLYIIQASIGDLTTYFSIPVSNGQYSYIKGATQVIYQSNGEPIYSREEYEIYDKNDMSTQCLWEIISDNEDPYIAELSEKEKKKGYLKPVQVYVKEASIYGIQARTSTDVILWTQPILVLQNRWASNVINQWDGKSIQIDNQNGSILSQAIAAGHKNVDNSFSGVMIGSWKATDTASDITAQTGVYGFHEGAMSYAWKDDGTGFIGKDGLGRIHFDGNRATIYSSEYRINPEGDMTPFPTTGSMTIDLNDPYIKMEHKGNKIVIDASKSDEVNSFGNMSNAPFQIGSKFAVSWDGTIYATGGNFQGTISASILQSLKNNNINNTIYLRGTITTQREQTTTDGQTLWYDGGYLGFLTANYGGEAEITNQGTQTHAGIGISYRSEKTNNIESTIKATASNAGMSCGDYYLSLQNSDSGIPQAVLRSKHSAKGRIVLDDDHIGLGFNGSNSYISIGESATDWDGAFHQNTILIKADAIKFEGMPAEGQYGIYARFA